MTLETWKNEEVFIAYCQRCIIEFDGSSKGNPRKAGAGVVVRDENGDVICRVSKDWERQQVMKLSVEL
ncbi:hypothetical protein QYF36_003976 [Acer negundo]|nr:hypothetical protein QYF36_003976 [Acer negundo]